MTDNLTRTVLSIAGSDPSGGAGIQADLKTFTRLGVYGAAAITCLTAQNTLGVTAVYPLAPEIVAEQVRAVLTDLRVSHIKIGMIGSAVIASAVSQVLDDFKGEIIYDPVLTSTSGMPLLVAAADLPGLDRLISLVTVLTPNLDELRQISGEDCRSVQDSLSAAKGILSRYPRLQAIVIKGGHFMTSTQVDNFLLLATEPQTPIKISLPRLEVRNSHGTGCTFASAMAAYRLLGADYELACRQSSAFVWRLLRAGQKVNYGHGSSGMPHHLLRK
ncbi:bifunctional hydroxymethylpyrimidine kinase/phosphomethylpyrimidine kinase [Desulfobacterota bacterium M19]